MTLHVLNEFSVQGDKWALIYDDTGEYCVLGEQLNGIWKYRSATYETNILTEGRQTMLEFLEAFLGIVLKKLKSVYQDDPIAMEDLKTLEDKLKYTLTHAVSFDPVAFEFNVDQSKVAS